METKWGFLYPDIMLLMVLQQLWVIWLCREKSIKEEKQLRIKHLEKQLKMEYQNQKCIIKM